MAFKFVAILAALAMANAGYVEQPSVNYHGLGSYSDGHLAVGHSSQDIHRTHGGTVSHISKQVVSPHSSVSKSVTSVNNDGYKTLAYAHQPTYAYSQPATVEVAKSISYQAPAIEKTVTSYAEPSVHYDHGYTANTVSYQPTYAKSVQYQAAPAIAYHQPAQVHYAAPAKTIAYSAPTVAKTVSYAAPAVAKTVSYAAPAVAKTVSYAAPAVAKTVSYAEPAIAKTVSYVEPAKTVAYAAAPAIAKTVSYSEPAVAKTISYSAPAKAVSYAEPQYAQTLSYAEPAQYAKTVSYEPAQYAKTVSYEPAQYAKTVSYEPAQYAKTVSYAEPAQYAKTVSYAEPAQYAKTVSYVEPAQYAKAAVISEPQYATKTAVIADAHHTPSAYQHASKTVSYSPAAQVAHFSFESPNVHYKW